MLCKSWEPDYIFIPFNYKHSSVTNVSSPGPSIFSALQYLPLNNQLGFLSVWDTPNTVESFLFLPFSSNLKTYSIPQKSFKALKALYTLLQVPEW